jgi:hypothetical protein
VVNLYRYAAAAPAGLPKAPPPSVATCPPPGPAAAAAPSPFGNGPVAFNVGGTAVGVPSPFGKGPASAAAEAAMSAFNIDGASPALTMTPGGNPFHVVQQTPTADFAGAAPPSVGYSSAGGAGASMNPFDAFGVSDSPAGTSVHGILTPDMIQFSAGKDDQSLAGSARRNTMNSGYGRMSHGGGDVTGTINTVEFQLHMNMGTPAGDESVRGGSHGAPNSAGGGAMSATPHSMGRATPASATPGSDLFTNHLPRRQTMEPGQYREAMAVLLGGDGGGGRDSMGDDGGEDGAINEDITITGGISLDGGMSPGASLSAAGGITAMVPGLGALADEDEDDAPSAADGPATEGFTFSAGITAGVPRLSDLAADDEDDGQQQQQQQHTEDFTDDFGAAREQTMMMLAKLKQQHGGLGQTQQEAAGEGAAGAAPAPAPADVTAAVPSLGQLADDDEDEGQPQEQDDATTEDSTDVSHVSESALSSGDSGSAMDVSTEASPAPEGLPMGTVTEDVAATLAAELAAKVAAESQAAAGTPFAAAAAAAPASPPAASPAAVSSAPAFTAAAAAEFSPLGVAGIPPAPSPAAPSPAPSPAIDHTVAMDLGFTTMLPVGGDNGPTERTGTIAFGEEGAAGALTPTGSDFGFTRMLEGEGAHDAWGGQRPSMGGAELTAALQRPQSMAAAAAAENANRRRMTMNVKGVQGIAHPADRRKSRAPFNMPDGVADGETMTVDLDNRGAKILGNDTFEFVYGGGGAGAPTPTNTSAFGGFGGAGASTPTLTELSFGGAGGSHLGGAGGGDDDMADAEMGNNGTNVDGAAHLELNLSDSFEVPPAAAAAAASVVDHGLTPGGGVAGLAGLAARTATTATTPHSTVHTHTDTWDKPLTETTGAARSETTDAFTPPGEKTMRMLLKMKGGEHGDAAATESTSGLLGAGASTAAASDSVRAPVSAPSVDGAATDTWDKPLTVTDDLADEMATATTNNNSGKSPAASDGTPANQSIHSASSGSDSGGFTPGPETLLMMEKLKGKHHGHAVLDSVRRSLMPGGGGGRPSIAGGWCFAASPLPPLGGAAGTAFTPNRATTIAGGPVVNSPLPFGAGAAAPAFGAAASASRSAFGGGAAAAAGGIMSAGGAGGSVAAAGSRSLDLFTPGAAQRAELHTAKSEQDSRMLGLPFNLPPVPSGLLTSSRPVDLEAFFHACEAGLYTRCESS